MTAMETDTLENLEFGIAATITGVDDNFPDRERFLELGFTPGVRVRVLRKSFSGGPLVIQVRGARYGLRRHDARRINVLHNK